MPELPEVETIVRGIQQQVIGKKIAKVMVRNKSLRYPIPAQISAVLNNAHINRVHRRSKYILVELDNGYTMLMHLGMSGRIHIQQDTTSFEKHDHFILKFKNSTTILKFNDPRRFGIIDLCRTDQISENRFLKKLGPEPLDRSWSIDLFYNKSRNRNSTIKSFIMDAKNVVGIGNIYASEALFVAKIHPLRKAGSLTYAEITALHKAIRTVLKKAIQAGGSSLKDYRKTDGSLGYFSYQFNVYDREGQECKKCKTIIQNVKISNRSSFFCPACQMQ